MITSPLTAHAAFDLHADLDATAHHAPTYGGGLSNHLPMALHALNRLGASPEQRAALTAAYVPQLQVRDPAVPDGLLPDWSRHIGQRAAFEPLRAHFAQAIAQRGLHAVLAHAVPRLMPGCGGDAFHGLIRLGHALDAGHAGEHAQALAYWACAALPLRPAAAAWPAGTLTPQRWVARVLALPRPAHPDVDQPRIAWRMAAWATAPGFDAAATALAVGPARADALALVDALAALSARLYVHTRNFTVLHVVTSLWALRSLLPHTADAAQAVREYAVALAAGLHAARLQSAHLAVLAQALPTPLAWPVLCARACASRDEHAAKFVWACTQWAQASGDAAFQAAASAHGA